MIQKINSAQSKVAFNGRINTGKKVVTELTNAVTDLNTDRGTKVAHSISVNNCLRDVIAPMLKRSKLSAKEVGEMITEVVGRPYSTFVKKK